MSEVSDSGDDSSSAALALSSSFASTSRDPSRPRTATGNKSNHGATPRQPRNSLGEMLRPGEEASEKDVVESEQMGFRLAREISHLRDRLLKWKEQCSLLESRLIAAEANGKSLEEQLGSSRAELSASLKEIDMLRLRCNSLENEKDNGDANLTNIMALNSEMVKARDDEIENLKRKMAEFQEQANIYKAQVQTEQLRNISVEKEVLDRAKSTEHRLRSRCSRLAATISEIKTASHKSVCEVTELQKTREELQAIIAGYKARAAILEQEESSRLTEISRLQGLVRESSISLAQCSVDLSEKDRSVARAQTTNDELHAQNRALEDQKVALERQIRELSQEVVHVRSLSDSAAHQAVDVVSRAKEGERKAQRELAAEKYRSEVAISEANERCADLQRRLQKEIVDQRHQMEEVKYALGLELADMKRALDQATVKASRGIAETRSTSAEALNRAELQIEMASKRAEKYERLYNREVINRKHELDEEATRQMSHIRAATVEEVQRMQDSLHSATERLSRLEGENRFLASKADRAEQENERLFAHQQKLEKIMSKKLKDGKISEVLGQRITDMRLQVSSANAALEQVRADQASAEKKLASALTSNASLNSKYVYLKQCNKDLLKTIKKYENICLEHGVLSYKSSRDDCLCMCSN